MNKRTVIVFMLVCMGFSSNLSGQEVFHNKELTITKLQENMWVGETDDKTTMYLVEGTQKALLIDNGTKIHRLDSILGLITKKPLMAVLTHAHFDHSGNSKFFGELWMHPADTVIPRHTYKGTLHFVKDGDVFDLGGTVIEVSHMPGHTPGSIVLLDRKAGNCYSGDAFGSNHVWLQLKPVAPLQTYISSCIKMEKLMDSGITRIYCGHYPYVKKAFDKSYITTMRQLAEALQNGTAPEAKPYSPKVGCAHPMAVADGSVTIVFDPEYVKVKKM